MKIWTIMMVVVAMTAQTALAGFGIGVFGSYWDPKDPDESFLGGGAKAQFGLNPNLKIELRASWLTFEEDDGGFSLRLNTLPLEVGAVFSLMPGETFNPYVGGGIGYYMFGAEVKAGGESETLTADNEFGFYGILGAEFQLSDTISIFGEAKYTAVTLKEVEGFGKVDAKLDGIGANLGLLFRW